MTGDLSSKPALTVEAEQSEAANRLRRFVAMSLARGDLDLPVMPEVTQKVLDFAHSDQFSYAGLAELIGHDPVMASKMLRYANSIEIGGAVPIRSLPFALMRIGVSAAVNHVVALSIRGLLEAPRAYGTRGRELYRHALETAVAAQQVARIRRLDADEAFLAGVTHDLGRAAVVKLTNDVVRSGEVALDQEEIRSIEDELHQGVGGLLAERWGLPDFAVATARYHHRPEQAPSALRLCTAITALANLYVNHRHDPGLLELMSRSEASALLGFDEETLIALVPRLEDALDRTGEAEPEQGD